MGDMAESLLKSISTLIQAEVSQLEFDTTIKANIIEAVEDSDVYTCKYNENKFSAYGTPNAYKVNDTVYITIPQGNWDSEKYIINKEHNEIQQKELYDPFKNITNENIYYESSNEFGIIANYKTTAEKIQPTKVVILDKEDLSKIYSAPCKYDVIGLKFKIDPSGLVKYNIIKDKKNNLNCTYGIRLTLYDKNTEYIKREFYYSTEDMIGNLYGFKEDIYQEVVFNISDVEITRNTQLILELYENGDFARREDNGNVSLLLDKEGVILLKDLKVIFGIDSSAHGENEIFLRFLSDNHLFYYAWTKEKNKKKIDFVVYNKTDDIDVGNIKLYYAINDEQEWTEVGNDWKYENDSIVPPLEQLRQDKIRFKYRTIALNQPVSQDGESESINKWIESNEEVCLRYRLSESNLEDDQDKALKLQYQYSYGVDLNKDFDDYLVDGTGEYAWQHRAASSGEKPIFETDSVKYVGYDNRLRTLTEAYAPHYIHVAWEPKELMFKDDSYLAGATITWKIPCPEDGKEPYLTFENNMKTIFVPAEEGIEYGYGEDIKYEFDKDGFRYMILSYTFSDTFRYSDKFYLRNLTVGGMPANATSQEKDFFHLSWRFRVKSFYMNTMTKNTVTCKITKDQYEFTREFNIPVTKSTGSDVKKSIIKLVEEKFRPTVLYYTKNDNNFIINPQVIHFVPCMEDYGTDVFAGGLIVEVLRNFDSNNIIVKEGYWEDKNTKIDDAKSIYYTLIIPNSINIPYDISSDTIKGFKSLAIKLSLNGRSVFNITSIPLVEVDNQNYGNVLRFIDGNNKFYLDVNDKFLEEGSAISRLLKPSIVIIPKGGSVNKQLFCNCSELYYGDQAIHNQDTCLINLGKYYNNEKIAAYERTGVNLINQGNENYYYPTISNYYLTCKNLTISEEFMITGTEYPFSIIECAGLNSPSNSVTVIRFNEFSDDFNRWDGHSVKINDDSVFASAMAAGEKNKQTGKFTGVILGRIGTVDGSARGSFGLYGYNDNEKVFTLTQRGQATFGKEGRGQIIIDGNTGVIKSGAWNDNKTGMYMDLDDGIQKFRNTAVIDPVWGTEETYYMTFDVSRNNLSKNDKPLKVGVSGKEKFSVSWDGTLRCQDAYIHGANITDLILDGINEFMGSFTFPSSDEDFSGVSNLTFPEQELILSNLTTYHLTVAGSPGHAGSISMNGTELMMGDGSIYWSDGVLSFDSISNMLAGYVEVTIEGKTYQGSITYTNGNRRVATRGEI